MSNTTINCPSCSECLISLDLSHGYCSNCLYKFDDFDFEIFNQDNNSGIKIMNIQNLMKLATQHAEEQRQAHEFSKVMETFRMMIMTTTINDLVNQDAIDKTLQKSADKTLKIFKTDCKPSDDEMEQLEAIANLAKVEVKRILSESAKIMLVKS